MPLDVNPLPIPEKSGTQPVTRGVEGGGVSSYSPRYLSFSPFSLCLSLPDDSNRIDFLLGGRKPQRKTEPLRTPPLLIIFGF